MLERQIMFKQLQEMQRRQQLQGRNQDYVSLTQAPPVQFAPTVNGSPFHDSQMLVLDNMQMVQRGESSIFQGLPSGFVLSQHHSNALGLSPPQFNMSSYTTNNPLEMSSIHPSDEVSSFMGRQGSFSSDQISMADGSFLSNQVFQENNLCNFQSFNGDLSSLSYSPQGITTKRSASVVESDASLDPLELKFLYNTDDQRWESSVGTSNKMGSGGFESTVENPSFMDTSLSIQSGSWSALMQSAVGETSSSDTAVQEEWSGLSFQNPDPSSENQPSNFIINSGKLQNDWVDRNLQNVSSPSSEPEQSFEKSHMKYSFPGFQQLGPHYLNQKDEFQSEAFHASGQHSSGHELKGSLWLHGSSSNSVPGSIQTAFDQFSQLNFHRYSLDSQEMDSRGNVEPASVHLGCSSDLRGQNMTAQSLPESQGFGFRLENADSRTPQSYSSLSLGNSSLPSLASHYEKDYVKNQYPPPITSCFPAKLPEHRTASSHNFQPSGTSFASRHVGLPSGFPTPWPDISTQQDVSSSRAYKFSSSVFQSPGSACSSLETSSGAPYEQPSGNHFKHEDNVGYEQRSGKDSFIHEGLNDLCNPTPLNINTDTQQSLRKHYYSEVDDVASGSLITHTSQQPSDQAEQEDDKTPIFPARNISAFVQSLHLQLHNPSGKRFPFKYDSVEYQQVDKARERLSGQKSIVQDEAKNDALQVEAIFPGENKKWNFSQGAHKNLPEKASSAEHLQSLQQHMEIVGQDNSRNNSIGSYQASNIAACQSQISLQMVSSWFNNYGTLKNGQVLSARQFSGLSFGKLQENNSIVQANSANASQGSEHVSPSSLIMQAKMKKRKIVAFDMVPWHKEVNCEVPSPQNISVTEFEWAQASNRRQEEATNEEIFDNLFPVVRAKRRLTFTTQFMQQVFRPAPAGILFEDACSNCEYVLYFTARFALGDACNLNTGLPSDSDDMSTDKLKTSKRTTASDFLEVVKCLVSRVKKLEDDLSRWDRNISIMDIKVESQELEKFSILNRFAKFHIKAHPSTVGPASSSAQSTVHKTTPQQYVIAVPMPKILPEVTDCLPL